MRHVVVGSHEQDGELLASVRHYSMPPVPTRQQIHPWGQTIAAALRLNSLDSSSYVLPGTETFAPLPPFCSGGSHALPEFILVCLHVLQPIPGCCQTLRRRPLHSLSSLQPPLRQRFQQFLLVLLDVRLQCFLASRPSKAVRRLRPSHPANLVVRDHHEIGIPLPGQSRHLHLVGPALLPLRLLQNSHSLRALAKHMPLNLIPSCCGQMAKPGLFVPLRFHMLPLYRKIRGRTASPHLFEHVLQARALQPPKCLGLGALMQSFLLQWHPESHIQVFFLRMQKLQASHAVVFVPCTAHQRHLEGI